MDSIILLGLTITICQIIITVFILINIIKIKKDDMPQVAVSSKKDPQINKLKTQINSLQEKLKVAESSYAGVTTEFKELKRSNTELQNKLIIKEQELQNTHSDKLAVEKQLKETQTSFQLLEKENKERDSESEGFKIDIERLKKESSERKDKLLNKEQELQSIIVRSSALEKELKGANESLQLTTVRGSTLEKELNAKNEASQILEKENNDMALKLKDSEGRAETLNKEIETQKNIIAEYERKEKEAKGDEERQKQLRADRERNKQKIGEILLAHNFITKEILDKALEYQREIGGNITQYLIAYGYINERQLAQCICTQFNIPYLPLSSYKVSSDIIKLVPIDIAEKYWLIPVEKTENLLTVVMADPLDSEAIKRIEEITDCRIQPFVGILSEIIEALESYYKVVIAEKGKKSKASAPFFVDTQTYKGPERREAIRFRAKIDVSFPQEGYYKKAKTKDVSRSGFLLELDSVLPIGLLLTLQIDLPREFSPLPIAAVVQVVRIKALENNAFAIGVRTIKISRQEIDTILKYASTHHEK